MLRTAGGEHLGVDEPYRLSHQAASPPCLARRGSGSGEAAVAAGAVVAEKLGHLPLAIALAAAYMRACDVTCAEYVGRLEVRDHAGIDTAGVRGYATGVACSSYPLALKE